MKFILLKDLPDLPKGTEFRNVGEFYCAEAEESHYHFTERFLIDNKGWFDDTKDKTSSKSI